MKPVIIHREAAAELEEAIAYYERQRPGVGLAFRSAIEQAIARIQQIPQIGPRYKTTDLRLYVVHRFPYIVFYAELEDVIWIVAIAHQKRRPGYWLRRKIERD